MPDSNQIDIIANSPLFKGIAAQETARLLRSSRAQKCRLEEGETIVRQGERHSEICIMLSGAAQGEKMTADGRSVIINEFLPGHVFGDMLSGASEESPVNVKMTLSGEIITIPLSGLLDAKDSSAETRERVVRNLINEIAHKYLSLLRRLDIMLCPTLRGKIAYYLLFEGKNTNENFTVPHSREMQAQILGCDRSALSRELSRMQKEGLISFSGKNFKILDQEKLSNY